MDRERFEELVAHAIEELPETFQQKMDNLAIVVEDEPPRELKDEYGRKLLLGLYSGVPLSKRTVWSNRDFPDVITIYQRNIERVCRTEKQIVEQVRKTVIHEIAHYFGMDEESIRESGY